MRNRSTAGDVAYSYSFLRGVVCLSSVTFVPLAKTVRWISMPMC